MNRVTFGNLIGVSPVFQDTVRLIQRVAATDAPVLIEGETGTGKEVAARAIHYAGARRERAFVPVNCGAIPENLIENEFFGHEPGAFSDARADWVGLLRLANGGTLFLDEVDALPHEAQVALLRFLQDQTFRPLGSTVEHTADVRVIAASNRRLAAMAEEGSFRIDLLSRLNVLYLVLPPLRERHGDIPLLAGHFLSECSTRYGVPRKRLDAAAIGAMEAYPWPGNVRELENLVHRAVLIADGEAIAFHDPQLCEAASSASAQMQENYRAAKAEAIRSFDRRFLTGLLARTRGNVSAAAACAGKERRALGKLLKKYGIDPRGFRDA